MKRADLRMANLDLGQSTPSQTTQSPDNPGSSHISKESVLGSITKQNKYGNFIPPGGLDVVPMNLDAGNQSSRRKRSSSDARKGGKKKRTPSPYRD